MARAILFDFDGVLVDSFAAVEHAWAQWAAAHDLDRDAVLSLAHGVRAVETIRQVAPDLDAEREAQIVEQGEIDHIDEVRTIPGAAALLEGLPVGCWAIVTSGTHRLASARLQVTGLPTPQVFVTADDVVRGKPAPEPYLTAARHMDLDPADCLVVEDSPAGVAAGVSAGMRVVAAATTHDRDMLAGATAVVDSVTALRCTGDDGRVTMEIDL